MAETAPLPERPRLRWSHVFAFWGLYWGLYAAIRVVATPWADPEGKIFRASALVDHALEFSMWALFTPGIFWLTWHLPITRRNYLHRLPLHVVIGLGAVVVNEMVTLVPHNWLMHAPGERHHFSLEEVSREVLLSGIHEDLIAYLGILTAGLALQYYHTIQRQRLTAARMEVQLSEARLQALRMQLHPHFLFNTLNTISNLTQRDPRDARRVIARLGELLRRALESTEQEIPLAEELRFARGYLDIVRARFGERLRVELHVEPTLEDALVPTLVLQPVLENAVEHGISASMADGWIRIEVERDGEVLRLRVSDNGPGFGGGEIVEGVGIGNTRARLEQLYGKSGGLALRETEGGGATVEITLPYRASPADLQEPSSEYLLVGGRE